MKSETSLNSLCPRHVTSALMLLSLLALGATAAPPAWVRAVSSGGSGDSAANAVKVGPDNSHYVTGQFNATTVLAGSTLVSAGGSDIYLAKYGPSGESLWIVKAGGSGDDTGVGLAIDSGGNIYLVGSFSDNATFGSTDGRTKTLTGVGQTVFLAKYSAAGALVWVQTGAVASPALNAGRSVAVNSATGSVYITAESQASVSFSSTNGTSHTVSGIGTWHVLLAKYKTDGNFQWGASSVGGPNLLPRGLAVDASDNAYVAGWLENTTTFNGTDGKSISVTGYSPAHTTSDYPGDGFIAQYDTNGIVKWVNHIGGYKGAGNAVAVSSSGEISLAGYVGNINSGTSGEAETIASSQPPGANLNLGGGTITSPYNSDLFISTYNSAGVLLRAFRVGGSGQETATGIEYDASGNLYVAELASATATQRNLSVLKYAGSALLWQQTAVIGGPFAGGEAASPEVSADATGNVFVAGAYAGSASFGTIQLAGPGATDTFVAQLSASGSTATVSLSNSSWTFGALALGGPSASGRIWVTNTGTASLNIAGAQIIGGSNSFAVTSNCPATLGINHTCSLDLTFKPTRTGKITATLQLNDDAPASPQTIPIQGVGTGPAVLLSTYSWGFQSHPVGQASGSGTVYATNTGTALLHFSSIQMAGQNPGDFPILSTTCGATLAINATCSVTFQFKPTAVGLRSASLNFSDDATPTPQSMTLSALGTP